MCYTVTALRSNVGGTCLRVGRGGKEEEGKKRRRKLRAPGDEHPTPHLTGGKGKRLYDAQSTFSPPEVYCLGGREQLREGS